MRAISDYVAEHFRTLGLPPVEAHDLAGGRQVFLFANGVRADAGPFASDSEIIAAVRKAFNMTDDNIETNAAPTADALPVVALAADVKAAPASPRALPGGTPKTPGDHASSIQDMMASHVRAMNDIRDASIMTLRVSLERQLQALSAAPKKVAEKIDGQTDDFLALMGQFTNDLGV